MRVNFWNFHSVYSWYNFFSKENLRPICDLIDDDLENIKYLIVEYQGTKINVNVEMLPAFDGKLIRT